MKKIIISSLVCLALLVSCTALAHAAISYTRSVLKATSKATTCALPTLNATAGSTLIVTTEFSTSTVTATIASTNSDTWSQAVRATSTAGSVYVFYSTNVNSGNTVATVTLSTSATSSCQELEYAGLGNSAPLDVTNASSSGSGSALKSGSSTTNFANEVLIGSSLASSTSATFTAGTGFTMSATSTIGAAEYDIVSSAASYSTTMTLGASTAWIDTLATFIGNPATPGTPTYSSVGSATLTTSWTSGANSSYYSLVRSTSANGTYSQVTTTTGLSYGDSSLTGNTSYWYEVNGVSVAGSSTYSASSTQLTLPNTPGTPTYSSVGSSSMAVSWTAPTGNAAYYSLARSASANGTYTQVTTTTSLSYTNSGLTGNTSYWYEVNGVNATGNGSDSATSTQLMLPAAPGTPSYSSISTSTLTVSWTAPTGNAAYYSLARATSSNGTYAQVTTTTGLSYGDIGLVESSTYWYEVRGVNGTGNSSYSATSTVATSAGPNATSVSTPVNGNGAVSGDSITIIGTNFGTVTTSNAATCNGVAGTGCIELVTGGTAIVASSSISSWSNTSITFTISSKLASNGGVGALQIWAADASDTTPLTFYIYPNITAVAALGTNAAREYNASDTDGLIMLSGDHFGASGTSTILGYTATQYNSASGPCTVAGYTSSTACFEVPTTIPDNDYSGTVILNRSSDNTQATTSLSILPRITAVNPNSTSTGNVVQLLGDHFCQTGTCPVSPNRSSTTNNVLFGVATSSDSTFMNLTGGAGICNGSGAAWSDGEICVEVPTAAVVGSASTTMTSDGVTSNLFSFTVSATPLPGAPGTPSYASVGSSTMTVSWALGTNSTYYSLGRATSANGTYTQVTTTTSLSYSDSGLAGNTNYWYEVNGVNGTGNGPDSATSTQLTLPAMPGTPSYSNVATSTLTVSWTAPTGNASYYSLARSTSANGTYSQITTTTSLSYNDLGLTTSTNYWYEIRGVNGTGNGSYSATSTVTTGAGPNQPPNTPSENAPANNMQNAGVTPTFLMTTTDPEGNPLQYKVTIYSNSGCSTVVQTDDESVSQTGWSGQNTSSSQEYTSGTQGSFTVQSALAQSTVYYWQASAKDPEGSNTWTNSATCNSFTTTSGNWTTDSGNWSIASNQLTVTPGTGNYVQLHVAGQNVANDVVEFQLEASGSGEGDTTAIFRADTSLNRYQLGDADYVDQLHRIGKTISGSYSTLTSTANTLSSGTFYEVRAYANGSSLQSWVNGSAALSTTDSALGSAGFIGLGASGNNTFTYENFAVYTSPTITLSNLPGGGSWSVLNHAGTPIACQTGSTWSVATYTGEVPIDYDNGGGQVAVWSGNTSCTGGAAATYPSTGLGNIFGGDTYSYSPATSGGGAGFVVTTSTTITISGSGLISD